MLPCAVGFLGKERGFSIFHSLGSRFLHGFRVPGRSLHDFLGVRRVEHRACSAVRVKQGKPKGCDMDMHWQTGQIMRRTAWAVGLCLAAFAAAAPVFPTSAVELRRAELTAQLVPVTGETERSVDLTVPFARGSAELTATARRQLDELGAALGGRKLRGLEVGIYGHTDVTGPAAYNLALSKRRALAVVTYLVEHFGLDRPRFRHEGYGEERLLEGVEPRSPRHRRVEVVVFAPEGVEAAAVGMENKEESDDRNREGGRESGLQAIQ